MKNKLTDLNDHIFAQIERLSAEGITAEQLEKEVKRGGAIAALAEQVVRSAGIQLAAAKLVSDHGFDPTPHLPEIVVAGTKSVKTIGNGRQ